VIIPFFYQLDEQPVFRVEDVSETRGEHLELLGDDEVGREQKSVRGDDPHVGHNGNDERRAKKILRVQTEEAVEVFAHRAERLVQGKHQKINNEKNKIQINGLKTCLEMLK